MQDSVVVKACFEVIVNFDSFQIGHPKDSS